MTLHIWANEIKLQGEDRFATQFNLCSDLFAKARNEELSEEERNAAWSEYFAEKLKLEQGYY
jgi:hypothetical protein